MPKMKAIYLIKTSALILGALVLVKCGFADLIKMPTVREVPAGQYQQIIRLNNPAAMPDETLAGLIFIEKGASVCTDYPRQEIIQNIDELTMMEKRSASFFSTYAIAADGKTFGYVSLPVDYKAMLWQNEQDEACRFKVQITWLRERNSINEAIPRVGSGPQGQ